MLLFQGLKIIYKYGGLAMGKHKLVRESRQKSENTMIFEVKNYGEE